MKVYIGDDYYLGTYVERSWDERYDGGWIFEVPEEQVERWEAAKAAWDDAQLEMDELRSQRFRGGK